MGRRIRGLAIVGRSAQRQFVFRFPVEDAIHVIVIQVFDLLKDERHVVLGYGGFHLGQVGALPRQGIQVKLIFVSVGGSSGGGGSHLGTS